MAFDGITVAAVAAELKKDLLNSRIYKIAQPESDELIITLKTTDGGQKRLLQTLPFRLLILPVRTNQAR